MNKNILEFCLSPDLGGLELFMINCYKSFKSNTNCFVVVQENSKLDNYLEDETNKLYLKRSKLFPIIPALKLAQYIDKNNIDICKEFCEDKKDNTPNDKPITQNDSKNEDKDIKPKNKLSKKEQMERNKTLDFF